MRYVLDNVIICVLEINYHQLCALVLREYNFLEN